MIDPFPNSEQGALEQRLQKLFTPGLDVKEPERLGLWYDPVKGQLCYKVDGKVLRFTPVP